MSDNNTVIQKIQEYRKMLSEFMGEINAVSWERAVNAGDLGDSHVTVDELNVLREKFLDYILSELAQAREDTATEIFDELEVPLRNELEYSIAVGYQVGVCLKR